VGLTNLQVNKWNPHLKFFVIWVIFEKF
jgi:hypothetical protein